MSQYDDDRSACSSDDNVPPQRKRLRRLHDDDDDDVVPPRRSRAPRFQHDNDDEIPVIMPADADLQQGENEEVEEEEECEREDDCPDICQQHIPVYPHDLYPHLTDDDKTVACPRMFQIGGFTFLDANFQPTPPSELCQLADQLMEELCQHGMFGFWNHGVNTVKSRCLLTELYRLFAAYSLLRCAARDMVTEQEVDIERVTDYLNMMSAVQDPFSDFMELTSDNMDLSERLTLRERHTAIDLYHNYVRVPFRDVFNQVVDKLRLLNLHNIRNYWGVDPENQIHNRLTLLDNTEKMVAYSKAQSFSPNASVFERDHPEHPRYVALQQVTQCLQEHRVVLVNTDVETKVMVALPVLSQHVDQTYTYTAALPLHIALQRLRADSVVGENLALHRTFINGAMATYYESSPVPLVAENFVDRMRYTSWANLVFCHQSLRAYYRRGHTPAGLPVNWRYFTDGLREFNGGYIRALKHFDRDLDYHGVMTALLKGVWMRRRHVHVKNIWAAHEQTIMNVESGDQYEDIWFPAEQAAWVKDRWEHYDDWIDDPAFLEEMEPLEVQMQSIQKIVADQAIPANAYRRMLGIFGRCLAGVMGNNTREHCAAQRMMEAKLNRPIKDRFETGCLFKGKAGTGKSGLLSKGIDTYIEEIYIGRVSDIPRPIDNHGTTRYKAVIVASDLEQGKDPAIGPGDAKKFISNEPTVHNRLFTHSLVVTNNAQLMIALNGEHPYDDTEGDMERRWEDYSFIHRINEVRSQYTNKNQGKTVDEVFEQDDLHRMPIITALAHKRRLLNNNDRPFYRHTGKWAPSRYTLQTQAAYARKQNSFRAFILGLEARGEVQFEDADQDAVDVSTVMDDYKTYCETFTCPVKDQTFVNQAMRSIFGVRIEGAPPQFVGLRYRPVLAEQQQDEHGLADFDIVMHQQE